MNRKDDTFLKKYRESTKTIVVLAIALLVFSLIFNNYYFVVFSVGFIGATIVSPKLSVWISNQWLAFGHVVGLINTKIILTLVFYILLTPIAILFRAFSKNPLRLNKEEDKRSYYKQRNHLFVGTDLEKLW